MARLLVSAETLRDPAAEPQFELAGWIDTAPFEDLLGMTIEQAGEGRARLSLPFSVGLAQGGGVLHGGALTALADTAVAIAIKTVLAEGTRFATTRLQVEFLAPVLSGTVIAEAEVEGPVDRELFGRVELRVAELVVGRVSCHFRVAREQERRDGTERI
jgi:uncharacterized protein (TIGR00369 family)